MRRWHRAVAPFFAALLLIVALTGVATRVIQTIDHAPAGARSPAPAPRMGSACKPASDRGQRTALGRLGRTIKAIHSGESLGPVGVALNLLSGLALGFFAVSGCWMYCQMWFRRRQVRQRRPRAGAVRR